MADLRKERIKGLSIEVVKKRISYLYMLDKYATCKSFGSMDRQVAAWKSLPVYQVAKLRKEVYNMPSDIKMVNPSGGSKISFENLWNSDKFTIRDKNMIKLRFNEGLTYEEIGDKYNISKDAVHKQFKKFFRLISRNCTKEEIFFKLFIPDIINPGFKMTN
ncbi:MAG: sigma factor-like helix-turn-helix DNA-binding protein [bacterium]